MPKQIFKYSESTFSAKADRRNGFAFFPTHSTNSKCFFHSTAWSILFMRSDEEKQQMFNVQWGSWALSTFIRTAVDGENHFSLLSGNSECATRRPMSEKFDSMLMFVYASRNRTSEIRELRQKYVSVNNHQPSSKKLRTTRAVKPKIIYHFVCLYTLYRSIKFEQKSHL